MALTDGLLVKPVREAEASTYDASKVTMGTEDSVESRVNDITSSDSLSMQRAAAQGTLEAGKRGLLNTSMAVGAAQTAVIDKALPMAEADAKMSGTMKMANQTSENEAGQFNAGAEMDISKVNADATNKTQLSAQQTDQQGLLNDQQNAASLLLQDKQGAQALAQGEQAGDIQKDVVALEAGFRTEQMQLEGEINTQLKGIDAQIAEAKANNDSVREAQLVAQKADIETQLTDLKAAHTARLSTQEGLQDITLENIKAANYIDVENIKAMNAQILTDMEGSWDERLKNADISQAARESVTKFMDNSGQQYSSQAVIIAADTNLSVDQKTQMMTDLYTDFQQRATLVADVYEVDLDWGDTSTAMNVTPQVVDPATGLLTDEPPPPIEPAPVPVAETQPIDPNTLR